MIFQFVILGALATLASSQYGEEGELGHHQHHDHHEHNEHHEEEQWDEPNYKFEYEVKDEHHGDYKKHRESRKGDDVEGYYSLLEPDGTMREVHYTSGKHAGFNAVVTHSGKPIEQSEEPKHETYHVPEQHHHDVHHHHHHVPEHHHHEIQYHHVPEHHQEIEHHHVPEHHHHHEIEHHDIPEYHHHEAEQQHIPEHHEGYHHHESSDGFEGSFGGDFGSPNSPVPSKLKPVKKTNSKTKSARSLNKRRPYSVYENTKDHRRRWASIME